MPHSSLDKKHYENKYLKEGFWIEKEKKIIQSKSLLKTILTQEIL